MEQNRERFCVSYDFSTHSWSDSGCRVVEENSSLIRTECKCSHLTNFGLIFDINGALHDWDKIQMQILDWLSTILLSLSSALAAVTSCILQFSKYVIHSDRTLSHSKCFRLPGSPRIMIVKHRAFNMVIFFVLFLLGFERETLGLNKAECTAVANFLHLFGLAIFTWTLLEGEQLYKTIKVR